MCPTFGARFILAHPPIFQVNAGCSLYTAYCGNQEIYESTVIHTVYGTGHAAYCASVRFHSLFLGERGFARMSAHRTETQVRIRL